MDRITKFTTFLSFMFGVLAIAMLVYGYCESLELSTVPNPRSAKGFSPSDSARFASMAIAWYLSAIGVALTVCVFLFGGPGRLKKFLASLPALTIFLAPFVAEIPRLLRHV